MNKYEFSIIQDDGIEIVVKCLPDANMQKLVDAFSQFAAAAGYSKSTIDKYILHSFNDNGGFGDDEA